MGRERDRNAAIPHTRTHMPLTDEQTAALATLADADPKEVADGLKAAAPEAYQTAFRVGYGTAKGELSPKIEAADAKAAAAEAAATEAKAALSEAGAGDEATAARIAALEKAAADAKAAAETARTDADTRIKSVFHRAATTEALAGLVGAGVREEWAKGAVLPSLRDRIRVDGIGEDGTPTVSYLDADGIPLSGGLPALVTSAASTVPADYRTSTADGGGGASTGGSGPTGYDPVAAGKARAAEQKGASQHADLALT